MNWITEIKNGTKVTFERYDTQYGENTGIEYLAEKNADGTFTIPTHDRVFKNVRYMGPFDNYREADIFASQAPANVFPYVCHVAHNAENAYILYCEDGTSIYIRV